MSGSSFVGLMGGAYDNGVVIFNYEWTAAFVLIIFAIFILPSYLRAKVSTVPEFLERRYDVRSRRAFSAFHDPRDHVHRHRRRALCRRAGDLQRDGISQSVDGGGRAGARGGDLHHSRRTVGGGRHGYRAGDPADRRRGGTVLDRPRRDRRLEELFTDLDDSKQHLILPADNDFLPWTGLWGVILLGFYYWTINQFVVQRTLGAKDLKEGQIGAFFAGFLKIPNLFLMILPGLIALKLYPELETPDLAFPTLAFDLMPIGIRGLIMAALIAAIMSSLDSALNSAGTLVTLDFVKPLKPDLARRRDVKIGSIVTGICMVIGAIYAPMIAGFESLFSYFQSSLSAISFRRSSWSMSSGLFVPWLNGNGAFWTIMFGLVVGLPLFILKEVTGMWANVGLPEIHYTIMSSLMMFSAIGLHFAISAATRTPNKEGVDELIWSGKEAREELFQIESPIYLDRTLLSIVLILGMGGMIWWFW